MGEGHCGELPLGEERVGKESPVVGDLPHEPGCDHANGRRERKQDRRGPPPPHRARDLQRGDADEQHTGVRPGQEGKARCEAEKEFPSPPPLFPGKKVREEDEEGGAARLETTQGPEPDAGVGSDQESRNTRARRGSGTAPRKEHQQNEDPRRVGASEKLRGENEIDPEKSQQRLLENPEKIRVALDPLPGIEDEPMPLEEVAGVAKRDVSIVLEVPPERKELDSEPGKGQSEKESAPPHGASALPHRHPCPERPRERDSGAMDDPHEVERPRLPVPAGALDVVAVLVLLLLAVASRWPLVFMGQVPGRGDALTGFLCLKAFAARQVTLGIAPLWNPHLFCGQPFLADPQTAVLSPFTLPFYLLPLVPAFVTAILLKQTLLAALTYVLLRTLTRGRGGAFFGAVVVSLSSTFFRQVYWQEAAAPYVWFPLVLVLTAGLFGTRARGTCLAALVLVLAAVHLGGHPQNAYYADLATGLVLALLLIRSLCDREKRARVPSALVAFILAVTLAIGLCAIQIFPLFEFTEDTRYATGFDREDAARPFLELENFAGSFLGGIYPETETVERTGYVGLLALTLAPIGLLTLGYGAAVGLILVVLGVTLALGPQIPLFDFLYDYLPAFRSMHGPVRALPLAIFGLALLSGLGLDRLLWPPAKKGRGPVSPAPPGEERIHSASSGGRVLLALVVLLTAAGLLVSELQGNALPFRYQNLLVFLMPCLLLLLLHRLGMVGGAVLVTVASALLVTDLDRFNRVRFPDTLRPKEDIANAPATARFLARQEGIFRAGSFTNGFLAQKRTELEEDFFADTLEVLYPNLSLLHGNHDPQGVYSLKSERYSELMQAMTRGIRGGRWVRERLVLLGAPFSPLYDLVNMRYLLTSERGPLPRRGKLERGEAGGPSLLPTLPRALTSAIVEISRPPPDVPAPLRIVLHTEDERTIERKARPGWGADPPFSCFMRLDGARKEPSWTPLDEGQLSDPGSWKPSPFEDRIERTGEGVVIDGEGEDILVSEPVPFSGGLALTVSATPVERGHTAIRATILDESGRELYGFLYGDEDLTAIHRHGIPRIGTRARDTYVGQTETLRLTWVGDTLTLFREDQRMFEFVDPDPLLPEGVRIALGSRGGRVRFESCLLEVPDAGSRTERLLIELPEKERIRGVEVLDAEGGSLEVLSFFALDTSKFTRAFDSGRVKIYRNEEALPRAFLVGGYRIGTPEENLRLLSNPGFDPRAFVTLEQSPGLSRDEGPHRTDGTTEITAYSAQKIELVTSCKEEALLFLSEGHYRGWEATVDGIKKPILLADHAFRAVALPPGDHEVVFRYRPRSLVVGGVISGLCLLLWLALPLVARVTRRRRASLRVPSSP